MSGSGPIPLSLPDVSEAEIEAVAAVLRSGRLALGPRAEELERALARAAGVEHAVAVSSGTAALHLCVRALGLGDGDEVLVPSFTFVAVPNALLYERATPVFVDVDPVTLNLDLDQVERAVGQRTRAIIAVHTFGRPAPMAGLVEIARRHRLRVIEDACEAVGAVEDGRSVGAWGDLAVFAFYPNKQLTTGEGGAVVTRDRDLAARVRSLANHGRTRGGAWLAHAELGFNYRMDEMSAALGAGQLARCEEILARREAVARGYARRLEGTTGLELPPLEHPGGRPSWFVYVVRLAAAFASDPEAARARDRMWQRLGERGIECGRYFPPLHLVPHLAAARGGARLPLPATERAAARTLALPFFNRIGDREQDRVCAELLRAVADA